ncbi:MAG: hypothetical protein ABS949_12955 [Solibacillus sp.]
MNNISIINEAKPVNVSHHTYRRECRYTRGIKIPKQDLQKIINQMCPDTKLYFEFHNSAKEIQQGEYLNGYSGLAKNIANYYKTEKNVEIPHLTNGRDFYVQVV